MFEKVPLVAVHVEVVALPPMLPLSVIVPFEHTVCGVPALAVAAWSTVITTVLVAIPHGPAPSGSFVVRVRVAVPLVIDGVYVAVSAFTFENVPLVAVQVDAVALPPMLPLSVMVPFEHTV
jgi:hypothetical protein